MTRNEMGSSVFAWFAYKKCRVLLCLSKGSLLGRGEGKTFWVNTIRHWEITTETWDSVLWWNNALGWRLCRLQLIPLGHIAYWSYAWCCPPTRSWIRLTMSIILITCQTKVQVYVQARFLFLNLKRIVLF